EPDSAVPPHVVAGMRGDGFDVSRRVPERLTRELAAPARLAISFEPDLEPYVGSPCRVERWEVPAVSDDYAAARDAIWGRVERLGAAFARYPGAFSSGIASPRPSGIRLADPWGVAARHSDRAARQHAWRRLPWRA